MSTKTPSRRRILWALPPVAVGVLVLLFLASAKPPPAKSEAGERAQPVRVVEASSVDLIPVAEGYGVVEPERTWAAVAQVTGRVVAMQPRLRDGALLGEGTELFRIDPVDYELSLAQARAELAELDASETNTLASLAIERQDLDLAQREMKRIARLRERGTASGSALDTAQRAVLGERAAVQSSENALALLPARRRLQEAKITQAERDLANTRVEAPFSMRITELDVEKDQYVSVGQVLFRGDAVDRVEVVAQIAMSSLRNLFIGRGEPAPPIAELQTRLREFSGFRPIIRLDMGGAFAQWEAEFVRFHDQVDPQTRTVGVVIAVDDPFGKAVPGRRPPLTKGMFVQVFVRGQVQPGRVVVPRSAIREGRLYVVNAEQRLQRREVEVLFSQGPLSVIARGVKPGERIVVSDPVPAISGMLLRAEPDVELQDALRAAADAVP